MLRPHLLFHPLELVCLCSVEIKQVAFAAVKVTAAALFQQLNTVRVDRPSACRGSYQVPQCERSVAGHSVGDDEFIFFVKEDFDSILL